jgi:cell wall assembly regulator SMI1
MTARITNPAQPLTPEQLRTVERRLGIELPGDYQSFLLAHDGGEPTPNWFRYGENTEDVAQITRFWSASDMESQTSNLRNYGVPRHLISIGEVSGENILLLSLAPQEQGAVLWNPSNEEMDPAELVRVADSLDKLLAGLDYPETTKPWMMFIDNNDVDGLRQWLDAGGSAQARDDIVLGITALEHAAFQGRLDMVKLLVSRGANGRRGIFGPTAHLYAVQAGHADVAEFLAQHGMAKGYWLRYLLGGVWALAAIGISLLPLPRDIFDEKMMLIVFIIGGVLLVGISLLWDLIEQVRNWWRA